MTKIGLVLEGGGMRGAYTSGVLEAFFDNDIDFNYIIGVSAGASCGASFVSGQRGRNREVFVDRAADKETAGLRYFFKGQGYLNMDYIYHTIPNKLSPFDYKAFKKSDKIFKICMTDCETGEAVYVEKSEIIDREDDYINDVLQASSSLPIITAPSKLDGRYYFDGGIVDSIPVRKAFEDGNDYNVVVLTRTTDYRKTKQVLGPVRLYLNRKFPNILKKLDLRHEMYNDTVEHIFDLERQGKIFVFRPLEDFDVKRLERDINKLVDLYNQGYKETVEQLDNFYKWLEDISED